MYFRRNLSEILIVSITPQFLERGSLWFKENYQKIKHASKTSGFWKDNAITLETDLEVKPSGVLRRLTDFGYEKTTTLFGKGELSQRGNILDIWPINLEGPIRLEFFGNKIEEISELSVATPDHQKIKKYSRGVDKLKNGDYVVHVDHGIGIYRGTTQTETMTNADLTRDSIFFVVEYAPPQEGLMADRLLVPLTQEKRLSPYIGFETPKIHRLGGSLWVNTRKRIKEEAEKIARELVKIYSERELAKRPPYIFDEYLENEFDSFFEFDETEDQLKAVEDIKNDFLSEKPMDRLICGDVGFGKTEIAMRAAFLAAESGRQIAVITPTTILANEHYRSFQKRFEKFPIKISCLSRLTPKKEVKGILGELAQGNVDITIGTHRLLSRDIIFKNLGLVIVDEEQRFGVRQKEKFKSMRSSVDVLSLSATPIPRTLELSLAKLRDVSLIRTPPPERLSIKNFILPYSPKIVREAVQKELIRRGQIYVLHNRVETMGMFIEELKQTLRPLKNKLAIGAIHGRMRENEMLKTMDAFREKKFDILVATTIIENGLDFSNVNTLIVEDASRLGLSQAYQIRGRIGRGRTQAYAYFLYRTKNLSPVALERLEALKEFEELGSGYDIALKDLEIRGSGNILGKEQSGSINAVGLNLYCQIIAEAVEKSPAISGTN